MSGIDRIEEADHGVCHRARTRLVQPARIVIGVVAEIEFDAALLAVDSHGDLERDPLRESWVRVMGGAALERAGRQLLDRLRHATLAVVEPLADNFANDVDAVVPAQLLSRRSAIRAAPRPARKSPYHCSGTRIRRWHMRMTSSML